MKEITLLKHNQEAYEKLLEMWETKNKAAVIQPTGTGKSYIIAKTVYDNQDKDIIILSPSALINDQFIDIFGGELDNVKIMTYDLLSSRFKNNEKLMHTKHSYFCSKEVEYKPEIIIFDEFHRCGAEEWGKGINKLLEDNMNSKVLGVSATHIRYLDNERNMADELFDGNVASIMTLTEAIAKGILPMPTYVSALFTLDEEIMKREEMLERSKNSEEEKEELREVLKNLKADLEKVNGAPEILDKYIKNKNGKYILFCKDNAHQKEMMTVVSKWFKRINKDVHTYAIYSKQDDYINDSELENFKNDNKSGIKLLFTINMFNEGLHLKNIDGVILLRPTTSPIIYYQQIGRAIDAGSKKQPLILDFVNNMDNITSGAFMKDLEESIEKERQERELNGESTDYLDEIPLRIHDETRNVLHTLGDFEGRLLNNFDFMFNLLCEYKEEFGDCNVTQNYLYKGVNLGDWVNNTRQNRKKGKLDKEKEQRLDEIGFIWEPHEYNFSYMVNLLREYKKEKGDCNVPRLFKYKGTNLDEWVGVIRQDNRKGILSKERKKILDEMDFAWEIHKGNFEKNFKLLCEYKEENGTCNVPVNYIYKGVNLGSWIDKQCRDRKEGKLDKEREIRLIEIGIVWSRHYSSHEQNLELLCEYKKEFGNCNVPYVFEYKGVKLGAWVANIRKRKSKLQLEFIQKLDEIGFVWNILDNNFEEKFKLLCEYKEENGNCLIPQKCIYKGVKIGAWVTTIRSSKLKLDDEKIKRLNEIGFIWEPRNNKR